MNERMTNNKRELSYRDAFKYSYHAPLTIAQCKIAVQENLTVFSHVHNYCVRLRLPLLIRFYLLITGKSMSKSGFNKNCGYLS